MHKLLLPRLIPILALTMAGMGAIKAADYLQLAAIEMNGQHGPIGSNSPAIAESQKSSIIITGNKANEPVHIEGESLKESTPNKVDEIKLKPKAQEHSKNGEKPAQSYSFSNKNGEEIELESYTNKADKAEKKRKIIQTKPKFKTIEGYQTTTTRKGKKKLEYVYGEVEEGKNKTYSGYVYRKNGKKSYVSGHQGDSELRAEGGKIILLDEDK